MAKRLLAALDYPHHDSININAEDTFRKIVVWTEENKIKQANPNIVSGLKSISSPQWSETFQQYLDQLGCPPILKLPPEQLQWLLGLAVQIETHNKRDVYLKHAVANITITNEPSVIAENPLDKLNFRSPEFSDGINQVAKLLDITAHPDALVTLKAVAKVLTTRLSQNALKNPQNYILKGAAFPYQDVDSGFDLKDPVLNQAAKILRILYIHDLRDLQTKANELIVAIQKITADPKTDTKLGKVGV